MAKPDRSKELTDEAMPIVRALRDGDLAPLGAYLRSGGARGSPEGEVSIPELVAIHLVPMIEDQPWCWLWLRASRLSSLENHVFPVIGKTPIDAIDSTTVLTVLEPVWTAIPDTARRILQRIGTVLHYAHIKSFIPEDISLRSVTRGLTAADAQGHAPRGNALCGGTELHGEAADAGQRNRARWPEVHRADRRSLQ